MNSIFDWLREVPNAPLWLAVVTVLGAGILAASATRFARRPAAAGHRGLKKDTTKDDPFQRSGSERRGAPRRRGNPIAVLVSDAKAEVEPVHGWVTDRSASGLGLELDEEGQVEVGTILSVRPVEGSSVPWVKVEVRSCRRIQSAWRLGCQYLRPPSADIQMRFG
jgi:hypothetical protein